MLTRRYEGSHCTWLLTYWFRRLWKDSYQTSNTQFFRRCTKVGMIFAPFVPIDWRRFYTQGETTRHPHLRKYATPVVGWGKEEGLRSLWRKLVLKWLFSIGELLQLNGGTRAFSGRQISRWCWKQKNKRKFRVLVTSRVPTGSDSHGISITRLLAWGCLRSPLDVSICEGIWYI